MYDDTTDPDSFFADADYADLEAQEMGYDRFRLGKGKHKVVVAEDRVLTKKDGSRTYIIKFTNDQGQDHTEYLDPITAEDKVTQTNRGETIANVKRQKRFNILSALGVPRALIPKLQP